MVYSVNVCIQFANKLGISRGRPWCHLKETIAFSAAGLKEHFQDSCGGVPSWLDSKTYYTAFTEGWGLYSENPLISDDTDTYKDNLLQKYGMLKWQVSQLPGVLVNR